MNDTARAFWMLVGEAVIVVLMIVCAVMLVERPTVLGVMALAVGTAAVSMVTDYAICRVTHDNEVRSTGEDVATGNAVGCSEERQRSSREAT